MHSKDKSRVHHDSKKRSDISSPKELHTKQENDINADLMLAMTTSER